MSKKLKIIRVTTKPEALLILLRGQLKFINNFHDLIGVSSPNEKLTHVMNQEGIRVIPLDMTRKITPIKDMVALIGMIRILRKERPDVVHSHTPKAGIIAMLASLICKIPHRLHTVAGLPLMETSGFKKKILLAASTHQGEEELMIKLAFLLRQNNNDKVLIIIAPRHIKRSLAIQNLVKSAGFDIRCRSKGEFPSKSDQFYLSDTMGEMGSLIEVSDLIFVAGSMVPVGGHSPSEAAQFGKPVIMGPHSEKCDAQIKDLVWSGGAIQIEKSQDLNSNFIQEINGLLNNPQKLEDMGKNSLIASGYAQQRADEASLYLLDFLKMKPNKHENVK